MNSSIIMFSAVFLFLATAPKAAAAAEIININYKYKIAFTDLTENDVRPGELVQVTTSDGKKVPLKVLETFPVMAKLSSPDGAAALTEEQFTAITVGAPVAAARKTTAAAVDDRPAHVESYSPPPAGEAVVKRTEPPVKAAVAENRIETEGAENVNERQRAATLERRLDEMMSNNVKLAENITQLLAEKNAAEAIARNREADAFAARKKANELSDVNADLLERMKNLEAAAAELEQDKVAQQKEIESLKVKLSELRKKLAKMVEIVNANTKAYEKQ